MHVIFTHYPLTRQMKVQNSSSHSLYVRTHLHEAGLLPKIGGRIFKCTALGLTLRD